MTKTRMSCRVEKTQELKKMHKLENEILEKLECGWKTAGELSNEIGAKRTTIVCFLKRLVNQRLVKSRNRYVYKKGRPFVEYHIWEVD